MSFLTSPGAFREFLKSSVWVDMKAELRGLREDARDDLETISSIDDLRKQQGRAEVLGDLIIHIESLPEIIADENENENEND